MTEHVAEARGGPALAERAVDALKLAATHKGDPRDQRAALEQRFGACSLWMERGGAIDCGRSRSPGHGGRAGPMTASQRRQATSACAPPRRTFFIRLRFAPMSSDHPHYWSWGFDRDVTADTRITADARATSISRVRAQICKRGGGTVTFTAEDQDNPKSAPVSSKCAP